MTRIAIVKKDKCNPEGCGEYLCIKLCPVNRTGKECIVIDTHNKKALIHEELCTGCGICPNRCPFEAISIINLPEELKKSPIHRYSENGFRLYNMPIPMFGKVVGILGKNGIGKSTAIKILAGIIKPNLGDFKNRQGATHQELINFFKGTEAQTFFEKLKAGQIKVAYKPQTVDAISKTARGKVGELLKKVDEKNQFDEIIEKLDLKNILENDIKTISGGELQRVAIAATVLKDANLYIFDEPTSYLDIKQRIRVSKFIRQLADENTAVLVVEHDLIILDYMTDLLHLMYGKEGCFGIVSQTKSTRNGINVYLSGYMKEENVRFRDKEIKFEVKPPSHTKYISLLISWKDIDKKLDAFHLKAKEGELHKKQVTGILGENGTGKTTFVKILAGVIKSDKGSINESIKVSYKPQYLEASDELAINALSDVVKNYEVQLARPLDLKPLMMKKLSELSGGELQRVAIAVCLGREAQLYLLDEPSAYLDVEQRLIISKVIREFMEQKGTSALIVDHDLLFADYLSESLMIFSGKPAVSGEARGPYTMKDGMNSFLGDMNITVRRDPESGRPRINKEDSVKDREQKNKGALYYTS